MRRLLATTIACLPSLTSAAQALQPAAGTSGDRSHDALLLDSLGRLVVVPTNEVSNPALLPSGSLEHQIPRPTQGATTPPEIQARQAAARQGQEGLEMFPSVQPGLMPYLATLLQPDFQVVWNASHNPDPGPALVTQLQFILAW